LAEELIRILIVDDTALYRQVIRGVLSEMPGVAIVGMAKSGACALEKIEELNPDLLTLDVQMPGMDGIEVLRAIRQRRLRPKAIMVSSFTSEGAQVTTDALLEGAFDFILKPAGRDPEDNRRRLRDAFDEKIAAFRDTVERKKNRPLHAGREPAASIDQPVAKPQAAKSDCRAVLLGTSTGGPAALKIVLPKLPATVAAPVLVVQHMPAEFTRSLAKRLDEICPLQVIEATDGVAVRAGIVMVAPGGKQFKLERKGQHVITRLTNDPPENGCRPSVDTLFRSAAEAMDGNVLGVVMTGMGRDGARGCREIKRRGGCVFAQHENDCTVYGMPKATIEEGLADRVLPLGKIGPAIVRHLKRSRQAL
jgi:two-component system chemotaxis response regulator CheB